MFKIGDVCLLELPFYDTFSTAVFEVIIRGPGYEDFKWTVECLSGHNTGFHHCIDGPIKFETEVGRWVNDNELTLLRVGKREPSRFGKFIRSIEGK